MLTMSLRLSSTIGPFGPNPQKSGGFTFFGVYISPPYILESETPLIHLRRQKSFHTPFEEKSLQMPDTEAEGSPYIAESEIPPHIHGG